MNSFYVLYKTPFLIYLKYLGIERIKIYYDKYSFDVIIKRFVLCATIIPHTNRTEKIVIVINTRNKIDQSKVDRSIDRSIKKTFTLKKFAFNVMSLCFHNFFSFVRLNTLNERFGKTFGWLFFVSTFVETNVLRN